MIGAMLAAMFALLSPQFAADTRLTTDQVWNRDGCSGANHSPALHWINEPTGVKSFALTAFDPDAGPSGWWHWIVYNIPASQHRLPAALLPSAPPLAQGLNDFGAPGYGGPCPPPGALHHYVFTVYALDIDHLKASSVRGTEFQTLLSHHILGQTTLTGLYGR